MDENRRSDSADELRTGTESPGSQTNYIIIPTLNCFDKLWRCLRACTQQTIPTHTWIINNGSNLDEAKRFLFMARNLGSDWVMTHHYAIVMDSVSEIWNMALRKVFFMGAQHALVLNNDAYLQPETYERLLRHSLVHNRGFITGISVDDPNPQMGEGIESPHPDFSCFLITRECFHVVGDFDQHFIPAYREDQDYHWRMKLAGIEAVKIQVPYYHDRSSTVRDNPDVASKVVAWDKFRMDYYQEKWGALWPNEQFKTPFDGREHSCKVCKKL